MSPRIGGSFAARTASTVSVHPGTDRLAVRGKFFARDGEKVYLCGVTYGPFRPESDGCEFHGRESVRHDFVQMADSGVNLVRVYTVPPRWLLDIAMEHGLHVMVGLPWEQHVTFLDRRETCRSIERRVREGARACAAHPAVLGYAVGNEIPAPLVRWYGRSRIQRFIRRLYHAAKGEDPGALVTYVNFPTTEYLHLPFLDFDCFNVYLEDERSLNRYLSRLQNLAGEKPLVMGEIGLDSRRNGLDAQAAALAWQVRTAFTAGCAGACVFSWTDEWHRGGYDIDDWDFGLVTRDRQPKPALDAVARVFSQVPFPPRQARRWCGCHCGCRQ